MQTCIYSGDKYTIYAAHLKNGEKANVHFVGPECKKCLEEGFNKLSSGAVYSRFNFSLKKLSQHHLKYLTEIDNYNHLALGAGYCIENKNGMAVARYIRKKPGSNTAEIAITVLDKYQNKGLGTILLCLLIKYGIQNNIKFFSGM